MTENLKKKGPSHGINICIATGLYPPDIGGPATYTVFLEKHADELGVDFAVVPFRSVRRYPPIIRHFFYLTKLIVKARHADVIYALDTISVGVPAMLASILTRKPLMLRVPGDYAWEQGQQRYGITETLDEFRTHRNYPVVVRFMSELQSRVARHATHVIVPSDYMKGVVQGWGVTLERITRIYSVLKQFEPESMEKYKEESIKNEFIVTTAARLVPWKGVHVLIDVVATLRKEGLPIRLHVLGDGVCREELEERARASGAGEHIQFFGAVTRDVLARELLRAHAFVLNTSYEGLSHQLIEVMSLGVPVVTTPVGGNRELVTHEETGLFVPFNDFEALKSALIRLRNDDTLARSLRERAKMSLDRFREDQIIGEIGALIKKLWKSSP